MTLQTGLNKGLPLHGTGLAVHPETHGKQNNCGKQRGKPLGKLALRTANIDIGIGGNPGRAPKHKGTGDTGIEILQTITTIRLDQESRQCGHYQQRFQTFTQQDHQRTDKGRLTGQRCLFKLAHGSVQQCIDLLYRCRKRCRRCILANQIAIAGHLGLNVYSQAGINRIDVAFHQFEAFQVGLDCKLVSRVLVTGLVGHQAFIQFHAAEFECLGP